VGDIDQTTGEVSGIGSLHGGIGKTLTRSVRGDEVLLHRHSLFQVVQNRVLDDGVSFSSGLLRLGHQATHTGKLGNLIGRTTGSGIEHHVHGIESLIVFGHVFHHSLLQIVVNVCPCVDDLIVTLLIGNQTHVEVGCHLIDLILTLLHNLGLLLGNDDVVEVERKTGNV